MRKGATLIEVLVAVAVFAILTSLIVSFWSTGIQMYERQNSLTQANQNLNLALNVVSSDLRQAINDPPQYPFPDLANPSQSLVFYRYEYNSQTGTLDLHKIQYQITSSGDFIRTDTDHSNPSVPPSVTPVLTSVNSSPSLSYFVSDPLSSDLMGVPLHLMEVQLTVTEPIPGAPPQNFTRVTEIGARMDMSSSQQGTVNAVSPVTPDNQPPPLYFEAEQ
ncbi:MAG: type II secretion system GspH family protein [Firmicutes bacterium]|nr:type II secretion system GspH family protein [Bacillota bacterium]